MKTKEERNALKEEVETTNIKLAELSEDELAQAAGGITPSSMTLIDSHPDSLVKLQHCEDGDGVPRFDTDVF